MRRLADKIRLISAGTKIDIWIRLKVIFVLEIQLTKSLLSLVILLVFTRQSFLENPLFQKKLIKNLFLPIDFSYKNYLWKWIFVDFGSIKIDGNSRDQNKTNNKTCQIWKFGPNSEFGKNLASTWSKFWINSHKVSLMNYLKKYNIVKLSNLTFSWTIWQKNKGP